MTTRRWMIAVAVVAIPMGAIAEYIRLSRKSARFRALAEEHAGVEQTLRWIVDTKGADAPVDVSPGPGQRSRRFTALTVADWEAKLKRKYERAARRPWLPVAPDPAEL
jgi:hypothetical protein